MEGDEVEGRELGRDKGQGAGYRLTELETELEALLLPCLPLERCPSRYHCRCDSPVMKNVSSKLSSAMMSERLAGLEVSGGFKVAFLGKYLQDEDLRRSDRKDAGQAGI